MSKLLFFDIDGTLAYAGQTPSQRTVQTIRRAREKGSKCFISTGRNRTSVPQPIEDIGFDGFITNAGATVEVDGKMIFSDPIEEGLLQETERLFRTHRTCYLLQANEGVYLDHGLFRQIWPDTPREMEEYLYFISRIQDVREYAQMPRVPVYKICFFTTFREEYEQLRRELEPWYSFTLFGHVFPDFPIYHGEINRLWVDKGKAMKAVCDHFEADMKDTVAFGDSTNDLAILKTAGLGIAMADGEEEAKQSADRVCPACGEDGVAQMLEELGLG